MTLYIQAYVCLSVCHSVNVLVYTYIHTHTYTYVHVYLYIHVCVYIHVKIHELCWSSQSDLVKPMRINASDSIDFIEMKSQSDGSLGWFMLYLCGTTVSSLFEVMSIRIERPANKQ